MAYLGNAPQLSTMRTLVEGQAYAGQNQIPVPGGCTAGMNDVIIGGATLGTGDFDDTNGMAINLTVPMAQGTQYKVVAWTPNQTVVNAGGQMVGFRNKIINGNFDFWQRGTSLAAASQVAFLADRFIDASSGTTIAASRQNFTLGQTDVPYEPTYFKRCVISSVAGAGNSATMNHRIEGVRTFAGQSAILSLWAKADSNRSIAIEFAQYFGTGGSPSTRVSAIGVTKLNLTTNWQKFTVQVNIPSIAGKTIGTNITDYLELIFWMDAGSNFNVNSNTLGQQSGTFDFAQIQFEAGSVSTQFELRPPQTELALCQRYYETGVEPMLYMGGLAGVTIAYGDARFLVAKRVVPSVTFNGWTYYNAGSAVGFTPNLQNSFVEKFSFTLPSSVTQWNGWGQGGSWYANAEL